MFLGENTAFWLFFACFIASIGMSLIFLERIREQLNRALPDDAKMSFHPPMPKSFGEFIWRTNFLAHALEILNQHRRYYPSSFLRKSFFGSVAEFVGEKNLDGARAMRVS